MKFCSPYRTDFYVYSGTCENTLDEKTFILKAGDVCIMNVNTFHSITCKNEDDIAVNCLMAREYFDSILTDSLSSNALFSVFSSNRIFDQNHGKYALFLQQEVSAVHKLFCQIMIEYLQQKEFYQAVVRSLLILGFLYYISGIATSFGSLIL